MPFFGLPRLQDRSGRKQDTAHVPAQTNLADRTARFQGTVSGDSETRTQARPAQTLLELLQHQTCSPLGNDGTQLGYSQPGLPFRVSPNPPPFPET